jgi:bifunctional non-homologous end joining protein LigD
MAKRSRTTLGELAASLAGARKAPLPNRVQPALAVPVAAPPAGENWLHEIKLDGYRMFCRKGGPDVRILSRNNQDWSKRFGSLVKEAAYLKVNAALLDGEVVVTLPDGRTSFQALQNVIGDPKSDKTVFYAFDLLHLDGFNLTSVTLEERKNLLQRLISESGLSRIVFWDHIVGNGSEVFEQAGRMGVEGIVSKRRDQPYRKGRTSSWQKAKCIQSDDFVVGGYTKPTKAEYGIGAILVGQYDKKGHLIYAGRVGTGFSEATRRTLTDELRRRTVNDSPFVTLPSGEGGKDVRYVQPSLVAHVEYLERAGEHNLLRHAVFRGLREDVIAGEVVSTDDKMPVKQVPNVPSLPANINNLPDIRFTHPNKLIFPDEGITKLDLAKYYAQVAELMLPHIRDRPLSLVRCPEGIGGPQFFQKRPPAGLAPYVKRIEVPSSEGTKICMAVTDVAGLLSLVQIYALEIHLWGSRADRLERPDRIVFDLDPDEAAPWQRVKDAALKLREILKGHRLETFLLATGGKGLHLVVPIVRRVSWERAKEFSLEIAREMAGRSPRHFTTNVSLAARKGKIYIDYLRNRRGATSIAPYSTRARLGAPVAVPIAWDELATLRAPAAYSMQNLQHRLSALKTCPWVSLNHVRQELKK